MSAANEALSSLAADRDYLWGQLARLAQRFENMPAPDIEKHARVSVARIFEDFRPAMVDKPAAGEAQTAWIEREVIWHLLAELEGWAQSAPDAVVGLEFGARAKAAALAAGKACAVSPTRVAPWAEALS